MTPTSAENLVKINSMFNSVCHELGMLYSRWLDEKGNEHFDDYVSYMQKIMPEGFKVTSGSKKPFGFKFNIGTDAEYMLKVNMRNVSWSRTK